MEKIIIENRTQLTMSEIMPYVSRVINKGKISNKNTQYSYTTVWESGLVISATKNKDSDKLIVYMELQ